VIFGICATLAAAVAPGCGGGSTGQPHSATHSQKKVVDCLAKRGISSEIERPDSAENVDPGEVPPLFDFRGEVGAYLGSSLVTIEVASAGDNLAFYEGADPPRRLIDAVWACAGKAPSTSP